MVSPFRRIVDTGLWYLQLALRWGYIYVRWSRWSLATRVTLLTDDLEATYKTLKEKGAEFSRDLAPSEWDPNMKHAMFKDPDGNEFWLIASH
ncbi:VOC family protein [Candidatus Bathyarchaeota archaeon]|nr:VOC family protein [Candidatus Bathyarchaeota archaeon]